jgi:hypothetical protein
MKTLPIIAKRALNLSLLFVVSVMAAPLRSNAQTGSDREAGVKHLVDSENYVFLAKTVIPSGESEHKLATDFSVSITKDRMMVDLPYFGNAHSAQFGSSQDAIQFTSTKFDYTVTPRKKGGWNILILPKDYKSVKQIALTVLPNGYTSLQVNSTNLDPISYNGSIASP